MPNQVSGTAGYWVLLDANTPDEVRLNTELVREGALFLADQLDPNVDYTGRIWVQPVDNAGNPGDKVPFVPTTDTPLHTLSPTPEQDPMSEEDTAAINTIIDQCIAAGAGPGVTVGIVSPKGYLLTSRGAGTGVNLNFRVASQTKPTCAHAVLRFVDQGLLSLDDTIGQYVSGLPALTAGATLRQCLMMTSGVYDAQTDQLLGIQLTLNPAMAMTVDQYIAKIKAGAPMFAPGAGWHYTNSNYFLLGKALEAVDPAKRTADKIILQDVLAPAGMVNTTFPLTTGTPPAPYAIGYMNNALLAIFGLVVKQDVSNQNPAFLWTSGAICSLISDMVKFGEIMRDGTLLSPEMNAELRSTFTWQPCVPRYGLKFDGPPTFGYGYGFLQIGSWHGHDGSWFGYSSCTMFEPVTRTVISVYENFQTTSPHVLAALSTVWFEIAEYLYPNSAKQPGYMTGEEAVGVMSTALPKMSTAMAGYVVAPGEFNQVTEVYTSGELASVTAQPVPAGLSEGVYVKGIGAGQAGYNGALGVYNQPGGSGGAGGGGFDEIFIPKDLLGPTFDAKYGVGGAANGGAGGDTIFKSGNVSLVAGGGKNAVGGIASATGIDGLVGHQGAAPGANSTGPAGAGGGRGGSSANTGGMTPGTNGGSSETVTGAQGSGQRPDDAAVLEGGAGGAGGLGEGFYGNATIGAGGKGGKFGGGGGGMGSAWGNGYGAAVGPGGDGGLRLRWV